MMHIITDDEINKLSESSKNDFYRILAELNPCTNSQYDGQQVRRYNGNERWMYCGDRWMHCDGVCAKCSNYLSAISFLNMP